MERTWASVRSHVPRVHTYWDEMPVDLSKQPLLVDFVRGVLYGRSIDIPSVVKMGNFLFLKHRGGHDGNWCWVGNMRGALVTFILCPGGLSMDALVMRQKLILPTPSSGPVSPVFADIRRPTAR